MRMKGNEHVRVWCIGFPSATAPRSSPSPTTNATSPEFHHPEHERTQQNDTKSSEADLTRPSSASATLYLHQNARHQEKREMETTKEMGSRRGTPWSHEGGEAEVFGPAHKMRDGEGSVRSGSPARTTEVAPDGVEGRGLHSAHTLCTCAGSHCISAHVYV